MPFSNEVILAAWARAGGKCERCGKSLKFENRGREGWGAWEAHHKDGNENNDAISNCEILCWECHSKTI